jgi:hypothetical protein
MGEGQATLIVGASEVAGDRRASPGRAPDANSERMTMSLYALAEDAGMTQVATPTASTSIRLPPKRPEERGGISLLMTAAGRPPCPVRRGTVIG